MKKLLCLPLAGAALLAASQASLAMAHATEEFRLTASDGGAGDLLGTSVDVDGDTIVSGAPGEDTNGTNAGAAYVFVFDGTTFNEEAKLLASDGDPEEDFGRSVTVDGDTIVVGAPREDSAGANAGAAYVFVRSGTVWTQQAKIQSSPPVVGDRFGHSVSVKGDALLVGAPRATGTGSAYVFVRSGTTWSQQQKLLPDDGTANNRFGTSVSLQDDLALVGASGQFGLIANSGAAYVYSRTGTVWSQDQKLQSTSGASEDLFGASVSLTPDDVLLIGAPGDDENGTGAGAAYRYEKAGSTWSLSVKRRGLDLGDSLGISVDVSHNFSVTGAHTFDGGNIDTGSCVLWMLDMPLLIQVFVPSETFASLFLGKAVAIDLCWIAAGAIGDPAKGADGGAVFVFETLAGRAVLSNGTFVNPTTMTTQAGPNIGQNWTVNIDTTAYPTSTATDVVIYPAFATTPISTKWGEVLFQLPAPRLFWGTKVGTGVVQHAYPLPNDPSFVGLRAAAQGLMRTSPTATMTNGELLLIGCFGQ